MTFGRFNVYFDWDYRAWAVEHYEGSLHNYTFIGPLVVMRKR